MIEKRVNFSLSEMAGEFQSQRLNEDDIENADETHFIINFDNGETLGVRGEASMKSADVISGGKDMTVMVRISGGKILYTANPLIIFKNHVGNYLIRGVPNDIREVLYRTGPRVGICSRFVLEWASESRALSAPHNGQKPVLFVNNYSGHNLIEPPPTGLKKASTKMLCFPANATDLLQAADYFKTQKMKFAWSKIWESYETEYICNISHMNTCEAKNGRLFNPGKLFF